MATTLQLYTPSALVTLADALPTHEPTDEHIQVHRRSWAAASTDEELHAARHHAQWLLRRGGDEGYPPDVIASSRLDNLAVIKAADQELEYRSRRGIARTHVDVGWPRDFLDTLKERVPVTDEIHLAVGLRRRGSVMVALCPFHDDRDPSLVVWPDSQRWRCFACNIGGDVLAWVQAWLPTDFRGAVNYLSARGGVPLPQRNGRARS